MVALSIWNNSFNLEFMTDRSMVMIQNQPNYLLVLFFFSICIIILYILQQGLTDQERQKLQQKFASKDLVSENPRDQQSNTMYMKSSLDRDNIIIEDDSTGMRKDSKNIYREIKLLYNSRRGALLPCCW